MDVKTGKLYASPTEALRAGVPPQDLVRVDATNTVRVTKGPFKGRVYQRLENGQLMRRKELER